MEKRLNPLSKPFNEKTEVTEMVTNEELEKAFQEVGKSYEFNQVSAKFAPLTDFKVKWQRTFKWAEFLVSDYVRNASVDEIKELATVLFKKIKGEYAEYPEKFVGFVTGKDFVESNRDTFIKRKKYGTVASKGQHIDLDDCVARLKKKGLIPKDDNTKFLFVKNKKFVCDKSALMRCVFINNAFDDKNTPEDVMNYLVYREFANIDGISETFGRQKERDMVISEKMDAFGNWMDMEVKLRIVADKLGLCY